MLFAFKREEWVVCSSSWSTVKFPIQCQRLRSQFRLLLLPIFLSLIIKPKAAGSKIHFPCCFFFFPLRVIQMFKGDICRIIVAPGGRWRSGKKKWAAATAEVKSNKGYDRNSHKVWQDGETDTFSFGFMRFGRWPFPPPWRELSNEWHQEFS